MVACYLREGFLALCRLGHSMKSSLYCAVCCCLCVASLPDVYSSSLTGGMLHCVHPGICRQPGQFCGGGAAAGEVPCGPVLSGGRLSLHEGQPGASEQRGRSTVSPDA